MIRQGENDDIREFPTVNRLAVVLEPTEVYLEWARKSPEGELELTLDLLQEDSTVYLIPEWAEEPTKWLKRNYAAMFEHELYAWCTDYNLWPEDRSLKNFKRFFRVRFHSIVVDMGKDAIVRDAE